MGTFGSVRPLSRTRTPTLTLTSNGSLSAHGVPTTTTVPLCTLPRLSWTRSSRMPRCFTAKRSGRGSSSTAQSVLRLRRHLRHHLPYRLHHLLRCPHLPILPSLRTPKLACCRRQHHRSRCHRSRCHRRRCNRCRRKRCWYRWCHRRVRLLIRRPSHHLLQHFWQLRRGAFWSR